MLLTRPQLKQQTVGLYLPARLSDADLADACSMASFVTVTGANPLRSAALVRGDFPELPFLIDPGGYELKPRSPTLSAGEQLAAGAANAISGGVLVDGGESFPDLALRVRLARAGLIAASAPDGFVSVSVTDRMLRDETEAVVDLLTGAGPVWLTLMGRNDPLELVGTVAALLDLVAAVPDVAVARTDVAAIGAVANGAVLGCIGLTSTYRHNPQGGGGSRNDDSPSAFSRTLMAFKKVSLLASWTERDPDIEHDLRCQRNCCADMPISRFADRTRWSEVTRHNIGALVGVTDEVLHLPPERRSQKFSLLMKQAEYQHARFKERGLGRSVPRQLKQWAATGP